jgi:hypothetical protein
VRPVAVAPAIAANEGYEEIEQILNADDFLRAYIEELLLDVLEARSNQVASPIA